MTPTSVWFPFVIISFVFGRSGRLPGGGGCLEVGFEANCRCLAMTDCYTGAILPLGTGLLTVFLNREVTILPGLTFYLYYYRRRVCVFAKFDQFLPVRSHFDTKRPVNLFHVATFQSATFGRPLFAFVLCVFYDKKELKEPKMLGKRIDRRRPNR